MPSINTNTLKLFVSLVEIVGSQKCNSLSTLLAPGNNTIDNIDYEDETEGNDYADTIDKGVFISKVGLVESEDISTPSYLFFNEKVNVVTPDAPMLEGNYP